MSKEKKSFKERWKDNLDWLEAFVFLPIFFIFALLAMIGATVVLVATAYNSITK